MSTLKIQMLGEFSISCENNRISDSDNRSRKVWSLLAYMIYHRNRVLRQNELIDLLWGENEQGMNPSGALKTLFYRVRSELDKLWDGAGHQLIICQGDGYFWNEDFPIFLDCDEFDKLSTRRTTDADINVEETVQLLRLYNGEFLDSISSELWVMPISAYYHNTYINSLLQILPRLIEQERYDDVLSFCRTASAIEPFNEDIHCFYMRAYIALGDQKNAIAIYQKLSDRLLSELGILPAEESRALYHEAMKTSNDHVLTLEMLQDQLREENSYPGALICEYDFFRVLYYSMARSVARSGIAVHIALLSVHGYRGIELSAKKLERIMKNFSESIRLSLRRGDSAARCSGSQFVIMLPRANYENSCMVCERICKAYYHKYPGADAELRYEVYPLQPDNKENFEWIRDQSN